MPRSASSAVLDGLPFPCSIFRDFRASRPFTKIDDFFLTPGGLSLVSLPLSHYTGHYRAGRTTNFPYADTDDIVFALSFAVPSEMTDPAPLLTSSVKDCLLHCDHRYGRVRPFASRLSDPSAALGPFRASAALRSHLHSDASSASRCCRCRAARYELRS